MDFFTFDYTTTDASTTPSPVIEIDGSTIISEPLVVTNGNFTIGSGTGTTGGYQFQPNIGPQGFVLASNVSTNSLQWVPNLGGGNGDVVNGGQNGPLNIGTNNTTPLNLISGGSINIGQTLSPDQIFMHGSIGFQYNNITTAVGTLNIDASYFFIEISNAGTNNILLPDASTAVGRQYIISKNFAGPATLSISTSASDTIDGNDTLNLRVLNQRIKLISNGENKWIII